MMEKISEWYRERRSLKALDAVVRTTFIGVPAEQALEILLQPQVAYAEQIQTKEEHLRTLIEQIKEGNDTYELKIRDSKGKIRRVKVYRATGYSNELQSMVDFHYIPEEKIFKTYIQDTKYSPNISFEEKGTALSKLVIVESGRIGEGGIDGIPEEVGTRASLQSKTKSGTMAILISENPLPQYWQDPRVKREIDRLYGEAIRTTVLIKKGK